MSSCFPAEFHHHIDRAKSFLWILVKVHLLAIAILSLLLGAIRVAFSVIGVIRHFDWVSWTTTSEWY